ncbi:MAG TPA: conjugal transfer protein, partial [Mycobacteriales bacterium]|nr:conjugal transfer protein [Mycobacteriales bacterium]
YVARFNKIFFSWDANNPKDRRDALASYFPKLAASNESAFGWNQEGVQAVSDTPVALRIDTSSDHRAVITTCMSIMIPQPNQQPNRVDFVCSAVSVYAKSKDSMVIDSYPALVSCPKPADINVEDDTPDLDQKNTPSIQRVLTSFFTAFAASDPNALNPTVARSADVGDGFHGARQLAGLSPRVLAPKKGDDPDVRQVRVRVNWAQPGQPQDLQTLPSTPSDYLVTVQKSDNAGGWIVLKLQPTLPSPELQPNSSSQDGGNSDGAAPSGSPNTSGSNGGKPLNGDTQGGTNTLPSTTP